MTFDLWLALFSAMLFSLGARVVKRDNELDVGAWTPPLVSNLLTVLGFLVTPATSQVNTCGRVDLDLP